ncbi:MAG: hypothetical protein ABID38_00480 [Candidatus Diapherotrites archaeon]
MRKMGLSGWIVCLISNFLSWLVNIAINFFNILKNPKEMANLIIQFILLGIILSIITSTVIIPALTPKTNIDVYIDKQKDEFISVTFYNNADFAGDDFKIEFDGLNYTYYSYDAFSPATLCKTDMLKASKTQEFLIGFQVQCNYIPPKSKIVLKFIPQKIMWNVEEHPDRENFFHINYWSKTTPQTKLICNNVTFECTQNQFDAN